MYGTVAHLKVKPGELEDLLAVGSEWDREHGKVPGAVATYMYKLDADPNRLMMAVVFESRESYLRNADDPATDKWFRRFREHLAEDPEWNDGEIVQVM